MKHFIISFLSFFFFVLSTEGQTLETRWLHAINKDSPVFLKNSSKFISGSTSFVVIGFPLILLTEGYIEKNENTVANCWYIASSVAFSGISAIVLKSCIKRERPYEKYPGYIVPATAESASSFPSTHTSVAFSLATSLSIKYPKWYVIAPSMPWAGSVAYSRMNMGVHYPPDVAAGAVLGVGSAWLTYKMNQWLHKPIERATSRSMDWLY